LSASEFKGFSNLIKIKVYPIEWPFKKAYSIGYFYVEYNKVKRYRGGEMSVKNFTQEEIKILSNNKYVRNVSDKVITYTDEFRRIFVLENKSGKLPRIIFEDHDFDINIIGMNRVNSAGKRWRVAYRKEGIYGLTDLRELYSGRSNSKQRPIERLKAGNNLLKGEIEMLKKIDSLERRMTKK